MRVLDQRYGGMVQLGSKGGVTPHRPTTTLGPLPSYLGVAIDCGLGVVANNGF